MSGRWIRFAIATVALLSAASCSDDGATTSATTATTSAPSADQTTTTSDGRQPCSTGHWPSIVLGEPLTLAAADTDGYYVWNDFLGWHVRFVNTAENSQPIQGRVVASARIIFATAIPEGVPGVTVNANELSFNMEVGSAPSGFDINVGCASTTVRFELNSPSGPWPVDTIFVGPDGRAASNPFLYDRQQGPG
jgi:hypothetical protein